jgi:large subunit ribosomal protein L10e
MVLLGVLMVRPFVPQFPGRQLIIVSKKWGFTQWTREQYLEHRDAGLLIPDGSHCKFVNGHGPLQAWKKHVSK